MSMLAEPRRKKEYRLLPKGKPLYEDENNFGTRMLQKMGWSKGKGLGANEDGNQEFIRVKYKGDANGLGFKDRDDGWTQHKSEFETLLKSLNNSLENSDEEQDLPTAVGFGFQNGGSKKQESVASKLSGESLEEKSKKSRARVHYKKFTRGKDLSQYSEKDLANIFGKKSLDISKKEPQEVERGEEEKVSGEETIFGAQMISTGTSINEYFKNKMALLKNGQRQKDACSENQQNSEDYSLENEESIPENWSHKKKKESIEEAKNSDYSQTDEVGKIKHKKVKQNKEAIIPMNIAKGEEGIEEVVSKKEKKRKNLDKNSAPQYSNTLGNNDIIEEIVAKSSRENTINYTEVGSTNVMESTEHNEPSEDIKKKSKKKRPNLDEKTSEAETSKAIKSSKDNEEVSEANEKKSKKKKRKLEDESLKNEPCEVPESNNVDITEKKSNKKRKTFDYLPSSEAEPIASKSKKSKKGNHQPAAEDASNIEESKIEKKVPSDNINSSFEQTSTSETIANNSNETDKPKKNKKSKKEREKALEPLQGNSETENLKATSTVSENQIPSCAYKINSFVAEIFRHTDIGGFVGSNLSEIVGYTLSEDVALEVVPASADGIRIYDMWQDAIRKNQEFQKQQRLQSEKGHGETSQTEPVKQTYKNNRRKKSWNKNVFWRI